MGEMRRSTEWHWCTIFFLIPLSMMYFYIQDLDTSFTFPAARDTTALIYARFRHGACQVVDEDLKVLHSRNSVPSFILKSQVPKLGNHIPLTL